MSEDHRSGKHVLAIDVGTGGPKVGLVNQQGQVVASASAAGFISGAASSFSSGFAPSTPASPIDLRKNGEFRIPPTPCVR